MMNNLTLPAIFAATLDSGLRRNDGMGFACLRATHRQAGMTMHTVMPDLISLPREVSLLVILLWGLPREVSLVVILLWCLPREVSLVVILLWGLPREILFCFVFNRASPVLDAGYPDVNEQ